MGQIKARAVSWVEEARMLSKVLRDMPSGPPGLLSDDRQRPALSKPISDWLRLMQETIGWFLTYQLTVTHKLTIKHPDGTSILLDFSTLDQADLVKRREWLTSLGVRFSPAEHAAFESLGKLSQILVDRYVCNEWKSDLPLCVAAIGGETLAVVASRKAQKPRNVDRRSSLARLIAAERKRDPHATAFEVLDRICNGSKEARDIVKHYKNEELIYFKDDGTEQPITLKSYLKIFAQQKPSPG